MTTTIDVAARFRQLEVETASQLQERDDIVHTGVLCLAGGLTQFLLGPPGTAKSMFITELVKRIADFPDGGYFHRLLTKYSTDDEVIGPPDIGELSNGNFVRRLDRKMMVALIVFLDEIFKANSSLLNSLLLAMNERQYDGHDGLIDIPMITLFSASNEMPEGEELNALYDRLIFRHYVPPIQEDGSWMEMMKSTIDPDPNQVVTIQDIKVANQESQRVHIPSAVYDALRSLRSDLSKQGIHPTDRRWMLTQKAIRAEAWLQGADAAEVDHTRPLMHMLWDDPKQILTVQSAVLELADPQERQANEALHKLTRLENKFNQMMRDVEANSARSKAASEIYDKMEKEREKMETLRDNLRREGREIAAVTDFFRRFTKVSKQVMHIGFQIPLEDLPDEA